MRAFILIAALAVVAVNAHPTKKEKNGLPVVHHYKQSHPDEDIPEQRSAEDSDDYPHNDAYSQTGECVPDQYFIDQCNVCKCGADGKLASCTLKACEPVEKVHIDGYRQGMKCPASQTFFDQCSSCKCSSDGVSAACTLTACPPSHVTDSVSGSPSVPHIDNYVEIQECTPGQHFIDVCNTCTCNEDGVNAACTYVACPPVDVPRIDNYQQGKKCPAGKTFHDGCNTCFCDAKGRSAACTLVACSE